MNNDYFLDSDGNPVTGRPPVQLHVRGTLTPNIEAEAGARLQAFLREADLSLAKNRAVTEYIAPGVTMDILLVQGVVCVDLHIEPLPGEEQEQSAFYGGIVIKPRYYPDETVLFGPGAPDPTALGSLVPEVASSGRSPTLDGRPAVPGVTETLATDWLVVQIAKDIALTPTTSIKSGAVKIYRMAVPLVGEMAEMPSQSDQYLLSADEDFYEFYYRGQRVEALRPLPIDVRPTESRICTLGFGAPTFDGTGAGGIVIVAADKQLFATNTASRAPGGTSAWQLLATGVFTDSLEYLNSFGNTITISSSLGVTTLTCSGSNGAGVCSGFTVSVSPVSGGLPFLTGAIFPMRDGSTPPVPGIRSYSATLTMSGAAVEGLTPLVTAGTVSAPSTLGNYAYVQRGVSLTYSVTSTLSAGANKLSPDRMLGGYFPRYSAGSRTDSVALTTTASFYDWLIGSTVVEPGGTYFTPWAARFSVNDTLTMLSAQAGATSDNRTVTTSYSASRLAVEGTTDPSYTPVASSSYTRTTAGVTTALPADPVRRWQYTARDSHAGAMAWRRGAARTAVRSPFGTESGSPPLAAEPLSKFRLYEASTLTETTTYSALALESQLIRKTGEVVVGWNEAFDRFGGRPSWAEARTTVLNAGEKYAMISYRTGPDYVAPVSGTAAYIEWFPTIVMSPYALQIDYGPGSGFGVVTSGLPVIPNGSVPSGTPGITNFSSSYSKDGTEPATYTLATFTALVPDSAYAYAPGSGGPPPALLPSSVKVSVAPPGPEAAPTQDTGGVADPLDETSKQDTVLFDIRTNGFIAQSLWWHEHSPGVWRTSLEAYIGNDLGAVPLRAVLDEWRALGQLDSATDGKRIRVFAGPVSLI